MNNYHRSRYNFKQYRPAKNKWQSFLEFFSKKNGTRQRPSAENNFRINPYKRSAADKTNWRSIISVALLVAVSIFWAVTLLSLPYFKINKIIYLGLDFIKKDDMDGFVKNNLLADKWIFPGNNYFLASSAKIEKELFDKYSLNHVEVKKIFPNELRIDLDEKISTVIYDNVFGYYLLDNDGGALKFLRESDNPEKVLSASSTLAAPSAPDAETALAENATGTLKTASDEQEKTHIPEYREIKKAFGGYPILYDMRNLPTMERQENILAKEFMDSIIAWKEMLEKEGMASVKFMTMEHPMAGVLVYTDQPWKVYFQPADDLNEQMTRLKAIINNNKVNEYVDLRFGDRMFWK